MFGLPPPASSQAAELASAVESGDVAADDPDSLVANLEMAVPQADDSVETTPIKDTIKTTCKVAHSAEVLCGGTWQAPPAGLELVNMWIERLRG